jgi:hypothetical protein
MGGKFTQEIVRRETQLRVSAYMEKTEANAILGIAIENGQG